MGMIFKDSGGNNLEKDPRSKDDGTVIIEAKIKSSFIFHHQKTSWIRLIKIEIKVEFFS